MVSGFSRAGKVAPASVWKHSSSLARSRWAGRNMRVRVASTPGAEERHKPLGYRRLSYQRTQQKQSSDDDSALLSTAELMRRLRYFSVMFLPKMKPNSSTARNWFASVPALPKTNPGV